MSPALCGLELPKAVNERVFVCLSYVVQEEVIALENDTGFVTQNGHGQTDYCSEVEMTLHNIFKSRATVNRVGGDVPSWSISVGNRTEQVTLYDIEESRSVPNLETPGLNELHSTEDAVREWYKHKFH